MRWWDKAIVVTANLVVMVNYTLARLTDEVCWWRTADLVVLVALVNLSMLFQVGGKRAQGKTGRR